MATITINGIALDPATQKSALKAAKLASADAHDSDYLFVQTNGPLTGSERAALEKTGAKILEFVPSGYVRVPVHGHRSQEDSRAAICNVGQYISARL